MKNLSLFIKNVSYFGKKNLCAVFSLSDTTEQVDFGKNTQGIQAVFGASILSTATHRTAGKREKYIPYYEINKSYCPFLISSTVLY